MNRKFIIIVCIICIVGLISSLASCSVTANNRQSIDTVSSDMVSSNTLSSNTTSSNAVSAKTEGKETENLKTEYTSGTDDIVDKINNFNTANSLTELFYLYYDEIDGAAAEGYGYKLLRLYNENGALKFVKELSNYSKLSNYNKQRIANITFLLVCELFIEECGENEINDFETAFKNLLNDDLSSIEKYIVYKILADVYYLKDNNS